MDARHVAVKGPGFWLTSSGCCKSSSMRPGMVSFSPSMSSSMSSWRGFSPGCLAKMARMLPEKSLRLAGCMAKGQKRMRLTTTEYMLKY